MVHNSTNIKINNTCGNNFYNFVNNEWLQSTIIPDDYQKWGVFQLLEKKTNEQIKQLIETNVDSIDFVNSVDSINNKYNNFLKIKTLYAQSNNIIHRNDSTNWAFINDIIQNVNACTNIQELFKLLSEYDIQFGINLPINFIIQSNFKNAQENILHLTPGGLGLPDRDFYFIDSKKEIRTKYIEFIKEYGLLFNIKFDSKSIFNLEKTLAEKVHNKIEKRNPELINNISSYNEFINVNPNLLFCFKLFEKINKIPGIINITNPIYMNYLNCLINKFDLNICKQYMIFHIILEFNYCLSEDIEQCYFNFYSGILKGTKQMKSRETRTIEILNSIVGELIGIYYADKYFSLESKILALDIVNLIKDELKQYLINNDWMEPSTKEKALLKLKLMNIKIGFPENIKKNYNNLDVQDTNTFIQNIINIHTFHNKYKLDSLYELIDRDKWYMNVQSINAYYSPNMNEIVFPAGILQEPFFSINQNIASNFGGFGMIIGHEITHGFDDQGAKFDAYGNLINWWSENDFKKYKEKTNIVEQQYNNYEIEGHRINGALTLGENIADIGGLALSYNAFKKYNKCTKQKYKVYIIYDNDNNKTPLFSDEQQFFINFANIWKSKSRKEDTLNRLIIDVHSPPIFRVNGAIRNFDEFYKHFNIKSTDKLYLSPNDRVRLWY